MINPLKGVLLLFMLFAISTSTMADDQVLQVWLSDGQVQTIKLDEQPVTKYADGNLVITTTRTSITYPLEQVRKYTYTTQADGITNTKSIGVTYSADGETLTFSNLKPQTDIAVYNVSGQLLRKQTSSGSGDAIVSCSHMPVGVYVVKVNGATYKISKR